MLRLTVKGKEFFDQKKNQFIETDSTVLMLEHSLVSISKWEAKYQIAFLSDTKKTTEQVLDYIRFMSLSGDISDDVLKRLSNENVKQINDYIASKQSATRFMQKPGGAPSREKITSELIYYWLIALQIPWETQHWHLERLLTLVEVCQRKNQSQSPKKMNRSAMVKQRQAINAQRRAQYNTRG